LVKITGTTDDPDNVVVTEVTYRVGIHKYTQDMSVKLAETAVTRAPEAPASQTGTGGGGSSGCDAGAGAALILAAGFAAARKRKGE
jgi:hypothetical protein